jgi:hypothetical protein
MNLDASVGLDPGSRVEVTPIFGFWWLFFTMEHQAQAQPPAQQQQQASAARRAGVVYTSGSGRRPHLIAPSRATLAGAGLSAEGRSLADASLPLTKAPGLGTVLDTQRVAAELVRHSPKMYTVAISEQAACVMFDIACNEAGVPTPPQFVTPWGAPRASMGNFDTVLAGLPLLVNCLVPVFGQVRGRRRPGILLPPDCRLTAA